MDKEINENPNNRDEAYYENLYNDLPQEVVDILLKTHPLRNDGGLNSRPATPHRERRTNKKRTRTEQSGDPFAIESLLETPPPSGAEAPSEAEPLGAEAPELEETVPQAVPELRAQASTVEAGVDHEDMGKAELAELVRRKPRNPEVDEKSFTRNVTQNLDRLQQTVQEARKAVTAKELPEADLKAIEQLSREEALDAFFSQNDNDDDGYDDDRPVIRPAFIVGLGVVLVLFLFLGYRSISLSSQLKKAETTITELTGLRTENEQYKIEAARLETEVATLTAQLAEYLPEEPEPGTQETGEGEPDPAGTANTYVVQAGDTLGAIARQMYGDFSKWQVIAEANNLGENTNLSVGQELVIPAQ